MPASLRFGSNEMIAKIVIGRCDLSVERRKKELTWMSMVAYNK